MLCREFDLTMNRVPRNFIALCMSLILTVFTICQAQAMTRVAMPAMDVAAPALVTACHQQASTDNKLALDCHGECQHVHQADIAKKLPLPDIVSMLALYELPASMHAANTTALAWLPLLPESGDPNLIIRFQRFLE